jgi:hypothetical protein
MVQYYQNRVDSVNDLEKKLEEAGYGVGLRFAEMVGIREKAIRRETRLVNMLQYIQMTVWKYLFNKVADSLERSTENEDECRTVVSLSLLPTLLHGFHLQI